MQDETRAALDTETPVNPYSLLEAVNRSSSTAHRAWVIFLTITAYLAVMVAGVTHKDLLLDNEVVLPLLQVRIGLTRFFLLAPLVFAALHLALLGHLALLARKALEFVDALRLLETTDLRTHPLRLEVDNFFLSQLIAGPERSRVMSAVLNGLGWATLVIIPVLLLLYMQLAFLPYHHAPVTWVHRLAVLADIAGVLLIGVFLMRPEVSFFSALWRMGIHNPGSLVLGVVLLAGAALFSLVVAIIPGASGRDHPFAALVSVDGAVLGLFPRSLDVAGVGPAAGRDGTGRGEPRLGGRDLRFARLERADLRNADLTGANLDGANLAGADLRGAQLYCAGRGDAPCASARGADLTKAQLTGAGLHGIDLRSARLEEAALEGAGLSRAYLEGTDFSRARLARADLSGASLQGAVLARADLRGADLSGALLQMTDFSGASLQGASLAQSRLDGAKLGGADLEGASLRNARLYGADLRGARVQAADLAGAVVWRTVPPSGDSVLLADLASIALSAPSEDDLSSLKATVTGLENGPLRVRLASLMEPLSDLRPNGAWVNSPDGQAWQSFLRASEAAMADAYRERLTEHVARAACRPRFADGAVAAGIARRAASQGFKGDAALVYERLRGPDCPAGGAIPVQLMRELAVAAETGRGQ